MTLICGSPPVFRSTDALGRTGHKHAQRGASLVEFAIVAPVMFLMGLGTLQAGLLYHDKTILNYATYEAARVGATRHAQHQPMRKELGIRLAPLIGGDGTLEKAATAMARSAIEVESPISVSGAVAPPAKLEILSPSLESFDHWGEESLEHTNRRVIPNSHLRHQGTEARGGLTLADANLLKIEVTHGVEMKVPFVSKLLARAMLAYEDDPARRLYLLSERFPLKSTATVRMQSEAWHGAIVEAQERPYGEVVAALEDIAEDIETAAVDALGLADCGEDGLGDQSAGASAGLEASDEPCLVAPPGREEGSC